MFFMGYPRLGKHDITHYVLKLAITALELSTVIYATGIPLQVSTTCYHL